MPTPGDESPIQRVPSGLVGPGGIGFWPLAQREFGGYHQGLRHLTWIVEAAERRRVDRLARGDPEDAAQPVEAVQEQAVRAAADDDHGAELAAQDGRLRRART